MPKTIQQTVRLPAMPAALHAAYLDRIEHAAITGGPVTIAPEVGARFEAFAGALSGRILHLVPERLIVQTWRSRKWDAEDLDSILTLTFYPDAFGARIELVQVGVCDRDAADVEAGWERFYWTPWRARLQQR